VCPENFLVGLKEKADKIFMVDFGNCKKYVDDKNNHIELSDDKHPFPSDMRFKSVHSHILKSTPPYTQLSPAVMTSSQSVT
jgi:hypothetical protein